MILQDRDVSNKPYNDRSVYGKLTRGEPLTTEDFELILDSNSIDNIVKINYENLQANLELDEYLKEKRELKEAVLASLGGILEYLLWQEEQKLEQAQNILKQQQNLAEEEFNLEEYPLIESSTEKGWINKLIKELFPKKEQSIYENLEKNIERTAKDSNQKLDMRAIHAVLKLASGSHSLRAFIFHKDPSHNDDHHCQLAADRILHVASILQDIHLHKFMNESKPHLIKNEKVQDQKYLNQSFKT